MHRGNGQPDAEAVVARARALGVTIAPSAGGGVWLSSGSTRTVDRRAAWITPIRAGVIAHVERLSAETPTDSPERGDPTCLFPPTFTPKIEPARRHTWASRGREGEMSACLHVGRVLKIVSQHNHKPLSRTSTRADIADIADIGATLTLSD